MNGFRLIKNGIGQTYYPAYNIESLLNWNYLDGYLVNMTAPALLVINGTPAAENTTINLTRGNKLVSYLRTEPMSVVTAMSSIVGNFTYVKDRTGKIYNPALSINQIGNMYPGQGYYIYVTTPTTLNYWSTPTPRIANSNELTPVASSLMTSVSNTGNDATLFINVEGIADGSEIGVWNSNGVLVGSGKVNNGNVGITVWGDNEMTNEIEAAANGEILTVKALINGELKEVVLNNINNVTANEFVNNISYAKNAVYFAKATVAQEISYEATLKVSPNPASSFTSFEYTLTEAGIVNIDIFNVDGNKVASLNNGMQTAGFHNLSFNATDLTSGVYNVVLTCGTQQLTVKLVVVK